MNKCTAMCNKLWDEVFIDFTGGVYSCCHKYPQKIGDIYQSTLDEIMNNSLMQKYRQDALNGKLECRRDCNISPSTRVTNSNSDNPHLAMNSFHVLKILYGEICNINCIMCWQDSLRKDIIDFDLIKKRVDISQFSHVLLQGGEPFACKEALDFAKYVMNLGVEVSFLTNGMLITEEWAKRIVKKSVFVHISINAATKETHEIVNLGSKWETVIQNVKMLRHFKELSHSLLCIKGHMTLIKENVGEIPLFINTFEELGFDMVRFGFDDSLIKYLDDNKEIKENLKEDIKRALKHVNKEKVDLTRLRMLQLI
jgi:sulfatase maturation enzyme AslB (radical SAM superfamily)